jgi:exonuclease SbcD
LVVVKAVKILHCADFHFDTPFCDLSGSMGEKRKEDLRETFGNIVNLVQEEDVDLLLLGGDLFDNERVSRMTIDYLIHKFREISDVRVFISPGNHDPYHEKSYYHLVAWPENVHIFRNTWEKVDIEELNVCVYGRGFSRAHHQESLLKGFCVDDAEKLNLMLLHGEVVSPGQSSDYNPITTEEIRASGLDYLALGHRHSCTGIAQVGKTFWAYSGCPEGRAFDELGDKGVLLGELSKETCHVVFKRISKRKYFEVTIDLSGCQTYEEIAARILASTSSMEPSQNLFKLILQGELPEQFPLYLSVISEKLEQQFYFLKFVDETTTKVDYQLLAHDFTLRGLFVKKMLQRLEQVAEQTKQTNLIKQITQTTQTTQTGQSGQVNQTAQTVQSREINQTAPSEQTKQIERRKVELALKYGLRILEQGEAGIE